MKGLIAALALLVVLGLGFFLYSSPADPAAEMTEAEIAYEVQLIEEMEAGVLQAINDRWADFKVVLENEDYDGWASFWTLDARILEPGIALSGDELFTYVKDNYFVPGMQILRWDVRPAETFVHGGIVYQIGEMDEELQFPGAEPTESVGNFFARWEKEDGVWKIDRLLAGPRDAPTED